MDGDENEVYNYLGIKEEIPYYLQIFKRALMEMDKKKLRKFNFLIFHNIDKKKPVLNRWVIAQTGDDFFIGVCKEKVPKCGAFKIVNKEGVFLLLLNEDWAYLPNPGKG